METKLPNKCHQTIARLHFPKHVSPHYSESTILQKRKQNYKNRAAGKEKILRTKCAIVFFFFFIFFSCCASARRKTEKDIVFFSCFAGLGPEGGDYLSLAESRSLVDSQFGRWRRQGEGGWLRWRGSGAGVKRPRPCPPPTAGHGCRARPRPPRPDPAPLHCDGKKGGRNDPQLSTRPTGLASHLLQSSSVLPLSSHGPMAGKHQDHP